MILICNQLVSRKPLKFGFLWIAVMVDTEIVPCLDWSRYQCVGCLSILEKYIFKKQFVHNVSWWMCCVVLCYVQSNCNYLRFV